MTKSSAEEVRIYSDGKDMLIAVGDSSFFLKDALLESVNTLCEREVMDIASFGTKKHIPRFSSTSLELRLRASNEIVVNDKINLSDFKMASSMTIKELFKVINKKLNKRNDDDK